VANNIGNMAKILAGRRWHIFQNCYILSAADHFHFFIY
jgi:hypothetical protein